MTGTTKRLARLTVAVIFVVPTIVGSLASSSSAAPTKAEVEAAKVKLQQVSEKLEIVIEQYNEARVRLSAIQDKLDAALADKKQAEAEAAAATEDLEARAVEAYTGSGSQLDALLGAQDLTELSDRIEFMGALAQNDADLATQAANARQRADWAALQYGQALDAQKTELSQMAANRADIQSMLDQQEALYQQLNKDYQDYLARQRAAIAAAAAAEQNGGTTTSGTTTGGGTDPCGWTEPPPPPPGSGAAAAVAAAKSVIGAPYVFGSANPAVGFDCSGLTSWAWAQAGVYLPHSSASQAYSGAVVPSIGQAAPGDLLFFYSPISHVALYLGSDQMIHARHPGPGGQVQYGSVSGYGTPVVRIVRPG
jgi:cell wall-associated NlpC family hydrolase